MNRFLQGGGLPNDPQRISTRKGYARVLNVLVLSAVMTVGAKAVAADVCIDDKAKQSLNACDRLACRASFPSFPWCS